MGARADTGSKLRWGAQNFSTRLEWLPKGCGSHRKIWGRYNWGTWITFFLCRGLCESEKKRLEHEEDRLLATMLFNIGTSQKKNISHGIFAELYYRKWPWTFCWLLFTACYYKALFKTFDCFLSCLHDHDERQQKRDKEKGYYIWVFDA